MRDLYCSFHDFKGPFQLWYPVLRSHPSQFVGWLRSVCFGPESFSCQMCGFWRHVVCFLKGSWVWIANGFNQRGSEYCFMKIRLCQRKRIISEISTPGNEWNCLPEWEGATECLPQWLGFLWGTPGSGRSGQVWSASGKMNSLRLLSPRESISSSGSNNLYDLGQLSFWEQQFAQLKNGTKNRCSQGSQELRSSTRNTVLEIWRVLQMLFLKECMVKWRVSFGVCCGFQS